MKSLERRIAAARDRMRKRYKDKDKSEVSMMVSSFQGLSPDEIRENFNKAAQNRC